MQGGRERIDHLPCSYATTANLSGPNPVRLNREERRVLRRILRQECDFHCALTVRSLRVDAHGFSLLCHAPVDPPDEAAVRAAWERRHAGTPRVAEIDRPGAVEKNAARMRNFSSLIGTAKQRFMQWYNAVHGTVGTFWEGRFRSIILSVGEPPRDTRKRFRRRMYPRVTHDDPLWKETIDLASRALGRYLAMMFNGGILRRL